MSSKPSEGFGSGIPAFSQDLPGNQEDMPGPKPESTKLEKDGKLYEYWGVGKLKNQAILITGGDSGIGRSVACLAAREGAKITIVHLPDEEKDAQTTKEMVEKEKSECLLIPFDLKNFRNCKQVVDRHMEKYGRLDHLINNASKQHEEENFEDIDLDNVETSFQVNVIQMYAMTKFALPHMKKGSTIICTTSVVAFRGTDKMIDYAGTKGAIVGFIRSLGKNLIKKGIRVNGVAPGPVHTPLQPASRPAEEMENFGEKTQIDRPHQPSEVAGSFIFLMSAEAGLYNGQVLHPYALGD